jgi:hypothetical protein
VLVECTYVSDPKVSPGGSSYSRAKCVLLMVLVEVSTAMTSNT